MVGVPTLPNSGLAIGALVHKPDRTAADIDGFVAAHSFPLIEGRNCTFVFRGAVDSVKLRHWIYGLASTQDFQSLPGTDFWYLVLELPERSRVEYKLEIAEGPNQRLITDPFNDNYAHDPFGSNSVVHGHGYEVPDWSEEDPSVRPGMMTELRLHSHVLGTTKQVGIYLPARFRPSRRYPLLIVHDGPDYIRFSRMKVVLDNLIHRLEIPGMIVAFTHAEDRLQEYAHHRPHADFLATELMPQLERDFPLMKGSRARGLVGASFGAVAAFSAAYHYPQHFGRLLLQSGSFAFSDIGEHERGPLFDPVVEFINEYRREPKAISDKIFMSCGIYESLIYENRSFLPILQSTGMDIRYTESPDGHNWENWRDRLREGLSWLYPGPLWMVYE